MAKDVPAFVEEPFMNSISNYITKFEFDIRYIVIDGIERPISSTWEVMCDNLLDVNTLGGVLRMDGYMSRIAKDIELTANTESEKIKAAYDEVKKIRWNGNHSLYADQLNIKFVHKEKIGNSAEINIALIQLLRNMGLEAYPVALSTRENGILSPASPSYQKLNHLVAYVKGENKNYLLDATEDYMPYDLLPVKDLNWKGRLLNRENLCWIDLAPEKKAKTQTFMKLKIGDDLSVEGEVNYRHYDYAASNFRKKYHEFNSEEEFIRNITENREGLKIRSCSFDNLEELNKPVSENYDVEINNKLLDTGDECLLYPFFFEQIEINPFKVEKRQYPVDFAYQRENMMIVQLTIPEGYEISEIPEPVQMQMEESACQLVYQIGKNQNMITLSYQMNINKELFLPEEYPDLREFYNQIIKIQSQPIVLKKI